MSIGSRVLVVLVMLASILGSSSAASANSFPHVVINEIHYHPDGDDDTLREFIELYNPNPFEVDLSDRTFTDGIEGALTGITIPGEGYVVLAPTENSFEETYGFAPDGVYEGKLGNSGDTIVLSHSDAVDDSVKYNEAGGWPPVADGDGPSLELIDPLSDNNDYNNWHASTNSPTPGMANNLPPFETTSISDVIVSPPNPTSDDDLVFSAQAPGVFGVDLTYRIGFEEPVTIPMSSDFDGFFFADLPPQAPGALVRYRLDASDGASAPTADDSIDYFGVVIEDPDATTAGAPVFHWFMADADYDAMMADRLNRDLSFPAVLAYDGDVYDNTIVEIRGGDHSRTNREKQSLNFDLPSGYEFSVPGFLDYPVDEFAMTAEDADDLFGRAESSWWFFEQAGFPKVHSFGVRLERNGDFYGVYRFQEKLDGTWRDQVGYDTGEFYKAITNGFQKRNGFDKKTPKDDDLTRTNAVVDGIHQSSAGARTNFLYDTFDVPALINYAAVAAIVDHDDSAFHNFYAYYDSEGSERWAIEPWDLDGTFSLSIRDCLGIQPTTLECAHDDLMEAIYESPTLFAMFWARVGTLVEQYLYPLTLEDLHEQRLALIGEELSELEAIRWERDSVFTDPSTRNDFHEAVQGRRDAYAAESRIPELGTDPKDVIITEILASPVTGGAEVLELTNIGTKPMDLSGYFINAVFKAEGGAIPGGTIILPGKRIVLTDNIPALTTMYPNLPNVPLVQYDGGLKRSGELVELVTPDGALGDGVFYSDQLDWPAGLADGTSIELTDLSKDNNLPESWAANTSDAGTPGARNSVEEAAAAEISVLAKGSTGDERAGVTINGTTTFEFDVTTSLVAHTFTSDEPVESVRVSFLNDQSRPVDRNLTIDAIEVDGVRYETESSSVESIGSWNPSAGCGKGFKRSQTLHCDGYFNFVVDPGSGDPVDPGDPTDDPDDPTDDPDDPTDEPDSDESQLQVIAWGSTGDERAELLVNGDTRFPFDVSTTRSTYQFTSEEPVESVRVRFLNDQSRPVDRNLTIDAIEVDGVRYQTESSSVESVGSWNPSAGCAKGFKRSQTLHCDGYFDFIVDPGSGDPVGPGDPTDDPDDPTDEPETDESQLEVIAWGSTGDERAELLVNGVTRFPFDVSTTRSTYQFTVDEAVDSVRVSFVNDQSRPVDRNLTIDAIEIDGRRYQTESSSVESVGSWNPSSGCGKGFKRSQTLHCDGYFDYDVD